MSSGKSFIDPTLARRPLLKGITAAAAASIFPSLAPRRARAAGEKPPVRFINFWTSPGSFYNRWKPVAPQGRSAPTETEWELGELHAAALKDLKQHLIYIDHLNMKSADVDPTPPANAHEAGQTHCLSATNRAGGALAGGPSIDQFIAKELNKNGPVTRFPSLDLDTWMSGYGHNHPIIWADRSRKAPIELDPKKAYQRFFGGNTTAEAEATARKRLAQEQQLSEFLEAQYGALLPRLSRADKEKLEAHSQIVSDLRKTLSIDRGVGCKAPGASVVATVDDPDHQKAFLARAEANIKLIVGAMSCDLTRVANLGLEEGPYSLYGYSRGAHGSTDIHDLFHRTSELNGNLRDNAAAIEPIKNYYKFDAKIFGMLLRELASVQESDGQTLLDHTVVLWSSQIAEGGHNLNRLPWIVAGGAGGNFKTGRYLRMNGVPHNNLFVSIATAMGVPIQKFGNPSVCTGPLSELRG